jgi:hypothetical protein
MTRVEVGHIRIGFARDGRIRLSWWTVLSRTIRVSNFDQIAAAKECMEGYQTDRR